MGKIGDLWVKLKLKADEYKKGLDSAKGQTKSFSEGLKNLSAAAVAVWGVIGATATKMALEFVKSSQTIGDAWDIAMTQISTRWQQIRAELNRGIAKGGVKGFFQALFSGTTEDVAMDTGKALSQANDAMTEIDYAFRLSMSQTQPKLHELYLKMMNTALSASDREAAAVDYRKTIEAIYEPRVKGLKDIMDKTVEQYLVIGGMDKSRYTASQTIDLIKMMASDPAKVEKEYNDFYQGYQSIGDKVSSNLVATMETYYNATNEMNSILKRADRTAQSMEHTGLDDLIKKLGNANDDMTKFRAQVAEEAEVIAADEEFQKMADPLEEFERTHADVLDRMNYKQRIFAELAQESYAQAALAAYNYAISEQESMDIAQDAADTAMESLEERIQKADELNNMLANAITRSISDSMQAFTDMLFGLSDADASDVLGALLQPFANTLTQLGEMLILEGSGIESFKEAMASLDGPVAIAAGVALVALGAALSSGIKALGSSGGSSAMSSGSSATSNANSDTTISTEMTIYVKGKISGKDILISGDNAKKYYGR
nr:MAG TPA: hypothetical protein [Caudoviricetes sp.]